MSIDPITTMDAIIRLASASKDRALKAELSKLQDSINVILKENRDLRLKNEDLENIKVRKSQLEYRDNAYYHQSNGPYCTTCFDSDSNLIRYITTTKQNNGFVSESIIGSCKKCGSENVILSENPNYEKESEGEFTYKDVLGIKF